MAKYLKFQNNPMQTREDFQQLVRDLFEPMVPYFQNQGAQIDFHDGAASFDMTASFVEGVARPLWGIIPLVAGGGKFDHWDLIVNAIIEGTDPEHPRYWGPTSDFNQRSVEMAAFGLLLIVLPQHGWEPLTPKQRDNFANWLADIQKFDMPQNNWLFFTILVQQGLLKVGRADLVDETCGKARLEKLKNWYLGDGWYGDGEPETIDHYGGFAMHYYGLLYAHLGTAPDDELAALLIKRAQDFAVPFSYWFAESGECLAIGRSLTYRFATAGFWGALALCDKTPLTPGAIKGIWARHLRSWRGKPIFSDKGLLTRGFEYPNLLMCEEYNSPTSPYWALKAFLPLLLKSDHPFWTSKEEPLSLPEQIYPMPASSSIAQRVGKHSIVHFGGPINEAFHLDKYNKFAYSTCFGMELNSLQWGHRKRFGDNIFAFSFDGGTNWQMRNRILDTTVSGNELKTHWLSGNQEVITTIQVRPDGRCLRRHRFTLSRPAVVVESGFAVHQWYEDAVVAEESSEIASSFEKKGCGLILQGTNGQSSVQSCDDYPKVCGVSQNVHSNTASPRSAVPYLMTELQPGWHEIISAFQVSAT